MKIRVNKNDTDVGSIKKGDCFWYKGMLFMRVDYSDIHVVDGNNIPAVLLSIGNVHFLSPDIQVEKADCMVVSAVDTCCENTEKGKWEV